MQKSCLVAGLVGVLAACGSGDDPQGPEAEAPRDAPVIDSIVWQGEQITFYDISGPADTVPAILTTYAGHGGRRELSVVAEEQAEFEPTPAEIWRAARGGEADIPAELLAQHAWQVEEEGRPQGFQDFDLAQAETEKSLPDFSTLFALNTTTTGLANPANRCWDNGALLVFRNQQAASLCSSNGSGLRNGFDIQQFPCDPILNANTTVRTGAFSGGGVGNYFSKTCGATGNPGTWSCTSAFVQTAGSYFASTTAQNGQQHRMGTGSFLPSPITIGQGFLGSATLKVGARKFENTSCNGFFQNF